MTPRTPDAPATDSDAPASPIRTPRAGYFDPEGQPLTLKQWAAKIESGESYKRVAWDDIGGGVDVSTVWLGLDHSFGDGPPLIFETMVFANGDGGETYRWSTKEQAAQGHARVVADLRALRDGAS